jgi:Ribbon-helix-helix protein, copG family
MDDAAISEKVILSAQVPASQRDQLARLATEHERSLSYVVRAALRDYLERSEDFSAASSDRSPAGAVVSGPAASAGVSAARGEDVA